MCTPAGGGSPGAGGGAALGMQAAGVGMSTVSAIYGAQMQEIAFNYQADISEINAKLSESSAQQALEQGRDQAGQVRLQGENMKGTQRTAIAANGVDRNEGSAKNILDSTDMMVETEIQNTKLNAARSAFGYRTQVINNSAQAAGARISAAGVSPFLQGSTSLLSGSGQVAGNWYNMTKGK